MVVSSFFVYLYRKKQDTDKLQQLIVQKRELLARETFSRRAFNRYEDMSDEYRLQRFFESGTAKYELGCMLIVKNQSFR